MSSEITTAADLDALHMAVSVAARAACVEDRYGDPWLIVENDGGDLIAWSYPMEDHPDVHNWKPAEDLERPLTVLYRPDRPAQPTAQPSVETLALVVHQGWQGYACACGLDDLGPVERETVTRIAGSVLDAIRGERP